MENLFSVDDKKNIWGRQKSELEKFKTESAQAVDAIILGAGPAGLSGAYELARSKKNVFIFEKESQVGGISKTIKFKGCFFDLGGHRFHTNFSEVSSLWEEVLGEDFLVRPRLSRIYYKNKFFDYPLTPINAFFGLGTLESLGIVLSYCKSKIFPFKKEDNMEQWVSNRFGKKLFRTFFKTYTEKVWGISCNELSSDWSAQRIKNLSLFEAIKNAIFPKEEIKAKTLIDKFRYPKYGPGMMYEGMAKKIIESGGEIVLDSKVKEIIREGDRIKSVRIESRDKMMCYSAENFISTIPISQLVKIISPRADESIIAAADSLKYRSFVSVGIILNCPNPFPDNWIYVHSPEIKLGRIQNFKNWSAFMVDEKNKTTLGLEYFCSEGDEFWKMSDADIIELGLGEVEKLGLIKKSDYIAGFVTRVSKAYPIYDKNYKENMKIIRKYLSTFANLQTIGRNGMFRYNNMDHSVLAGLWAAGNILGEKNNIWDIND
jgi:protoporphyrinogen oxidase